MNKHGRVSSQSDFSFWPFESDDQPGQLLTVDMAEKVAKISKNCKPINSTILDFVPLKAHCASEVNCIPVNMKNSCKNTLR